VKYGVIFPQTEIGSDPLAVRDYAQAAEGLGFSHILAYDHVLGAEPSGRPPGWRGSYTIESNFHEPFVLFAYLSGLTSRIGFLTGVIILPQRQAVLVAKQAAAVDVLSGGRLRLGVGLGWNHVEYEALGEDFTSRGRRIAEQIRVMRALWTNPSVEFTGRWHRIDRAGIKPMPVQQPIPVWMGGSAEPALKRIARIADGWLPQARGSDPVTAAMIERLRGYVQQAGRRAEDVGIEGRIPYANMTPEDWAQDVDAWRELGASHASINTMGAGLSSAGEHIEAISRFQKAIARTSGEFSA
jgi:probable F420-dependent oxidoreductase